MTYELAITCPAVELAQAVMTLLETDGYRWNGGETTANLNCGAYGVTYFLTENKKILYSPGTTPASRAKEMISAEEFITRKGSAGIDVDEYL